jgi:hypothetical protein
MGRSIRRSTRRDGKDARAGECREVGLGERTSRARRKTVAVSFEPVPVAIARAATIASARPAHVPIGWHHPIGMKWRLGR